MKKWIKTVSIFCSIILSFGTLFGCADTPDETPAGTNSSSSSGTVNGEDTTVGTYNPEWLASPVLETKQDLSINEKYFVGLGGLTLDTGTGVEQGVTSEYVAKMAGALGAKSQRVWMHLTQIIGRDVNTPGDIPGECRYYINETEADKYHEYIRLLKENGVERIVAHSSSIWPLHDYYYQTTGVVPNPWNGEYEEYVRWLKMVGEWYVMLQTEFPEVDYWEWQNEVNVFDGEPIYPAYYPVDNSIKFTTYQKAVIIADLSWYIYRAVLSVNPNAVVTSPGFVVWNGCGSWFNDLYAAINSKCLPSGQPFYDTDPDHYFGIMVTHPYPYTHGIDKTIGFLDEVYTVMKANGDGDKKMWLTETGISPYEDLTLTSGEGLANYDEITEMYPQWLDALKKTSYVETAFLFRCSNLTYFMSGAAALRESNYGLFYSPADPENPGMPKPWTVAIYKYLYGENADTTPLYWYYNEKTKKD